MCLVETEEGLLITKGQYQLTRLMPSKLSLGEMYDYTFLKGKVKEKEVLEKNEKNFHRKSEIIAFSKELSKYNLSYSILSSQKPKKEIERMKAITIASFVSNCQQSKETLLSKKELLDEMIIDRFNVSKNFIQKNRFYLIAISLLLIGPYSELKSFFLKGVAL